MYIGGPIGSRVKFDEVSSSASLSIHYNNVHHLYEVTVHSTCIYMGCAYIIIIAKIECII